MKNPWMKGLLCALIIAIAAVIAVVMVKSRPDISRRAAEAPLPAVEVMTSQPASVPVTVNSRGTVIPRRDIQFASEVSGKIIEATDDFVEGGRVVQGQTLLRIDPIDYEVARSEAEAALASARYSLAEVQVVVMKAAIEEAEARVQAAQDRLRQAEDALAKTTLKAPFDAIVTEKRADLGQFLQPGTVVARLLSTARVEVRLPVLAADLPFISYGQAPDGSWPTAQLKARFGDTEHHWEARLVRLEQRVDEQTRVFYLVAEVDQPYNLDRYATALSVGLFVEASISGKAIDNAVRLPRAALHGDGFVYIVDQGMLRKRPVELLRREADSVIVGKGLSSGEQVLLTRLDLMVDGMAVAVEQ